MSQRSIFFLLALLGACSSLALFSRSQSERPPNSLAEEVRRSWDFSHFDKTTIDEHFTAVVASEGGSHVFNRKDFEDFVAHLQRNKEKYDVSGFKVLSTDESPDSIFASISYEVFWNITIDNRSNATYAVYHDTWEREIDGWHRLAAAIFSKKMESMAVQGPPQSISAIRDNKGTHIAIAPVAKSAKVTCLSAASDFPKPQVKPTCRINAPGFLGVLQVNSTISTSDNGTVQLACAG